MRMPMRVRVCACVRMPLQARQRPYKRLLRLPYVFTLSFFIQFIQKIYKTQKRGKIPLFMGKKLGKQGFLKKRKK